MKAILKRYIPLIAALLVLGAIITFLPACADVEVKVEGTEEVTTTKPAGKVVVDKLPIPAPKKVSLPSTTVEQTTTTVSTVAPEIPAVGFSEGTSGEEVRFLQETMVYQGYLSGSSAVDGIWGSNTSKAFAAFERANGWDVDGTMTFEEFEVLMNELYTSIEYEVDDAAYDYTDDPVADEIQAPATTPPPPAATTPPPALTPCDSADWFTNNPANTVNQSELVVYYRKAATACAPGTLVHHSATSWLRNAGY